MEKRKKRLILAYPNMRWQKDDIVTNWNLEPTTLCLLAQMVREKVDVKIIDAQFENMSRDTFKAQVAEFNPDYAGLSLLTSEYADSLDIAANIIKSIDADISANIEKHKTQFIEAMDNDFNTPQALAALFDFSKAVNTLINSDEPVSGGTLKAIDETYRTLGGDILGIIPDDVAGTGGASSGLDDELMQILIDLRAAARKNKDWATSDAIRDQLAAIGVVLEDRPDGTVWKVS